MFNKVLIANRGEIALRVIRACRELGIPTVSIHSEADARALHVRLADQSICIGPADSARSYLHIPAIIAAAEISGADAIHPGYGFLSEDANFAALCRRAGLIFIGPRPEDMHLWGDKVRARAKAKSLGLPLMEGSGELQSVEMALEEAERVGYPVMLKASGGGGGRGMRIIRSASELKEAFPRAKAEAGMSFKNDAIYLERFVEKPRHIEWQILADGKGAVWVLGERECSIQRRHQKVIEESPSPAVSDELREEMAEKITHAMRESGYVSAGTLEFLMDEDGNLSFMEMNTRIQVEHPVTEMVLGIDLVAEQIRIAAGEEPTIPNRPLKPRGHAIECRINAEDPVTFAPWPGLITDFHLPGGTGIRVDSGVYGGYKVPPNYDSLLLKIISHGASREEAIARMQRALKETIIEGIRTNVPLHQKILAEEDFKSGEISTRFLERW